MKINALMALSDTKVIRSKDIQNIVGALIQKL